MNTSAKIIAEYLSPEDETMDPREVWKATDAVKMLVSIKNTDRLVAAMESLDATMMLQIRSAKSRSKSR